ncbi:DUF3879 family protein [Lachnospiraceae bacterium 62-35]
MRIGEVNSQNYQALLQMFQRLNGNKGSFKDPLGILNSKGLTGGGSSPDMVEVAPGFFCQNNPTIIANWKKQFDKDGDLINSHGVAGMDITGKSPSEWHKIVDVSEEGRQSMFDMVKREFIQENGIQNGDTTQRSEVFAAYQKSIPKEDRLTATWTLGQYERMYNAACYEAVRASDPSWQPGQYFDPRVLDNVTRESVEARIVQEGSDSFALKSIDCKV